MDKEEHLLQLQVEIQRGIKRNPAAMFDAFFVIIIEEAIKKYEDFLSGGLEAEFTKTDRVNLFCGFVERAATFWETAENDDSCEMAIKILKEFEIQRKLKNRITGKKFLRRGK